MKTWETPLAQVQRFVANDHVAACYNFFAWLTCAIPGKYDYQVGDGTTARDNHGICANGGQVEFDGGNIGYEYTKDYWGNLTENTNRPISNVQLGSFVGTSQPSGNTSYDDTISDFSSQDDIWNDWVANGGQTNSDLNLYYHAVWTSTDNENHTGDYRHYGLARIWQVKNGANWSG